MKVLVKENGKKTWNKIHENGEIEKIENTTDLLDLDFATEEKKEVTIKSKINDEVKVDVASETEITKDITASFTIKVAGNNNKYCSKSCQYHGFASVGEVCYFFFNYVCEIEKRTGKRLRCTPCKSESFFNNGD